MNKKQFIKSVLKKYDPINVDDQFYVLFMIADLYWDACESHKKAVKKNDEELKKESYIRMEELLMIIELWTKPLLDEYPFRKYMIKETKKNYAELFGEIKSKGGIN